MDGNKDDALKCLKIGKEALQKGDRTRALKFLNKARRLDPTLPLDDLFSTVNSDAGDHPPDEATESPQKMPADNPSIRRRPSAPATAPGPSSSASSSPSSYTEEHVSIVREIKRKKNYYEILGLEKGCTVEDVRKSYRKLSLKVHPDKNKAPGAEEAFKAVSKAFQCLSNEESRKKYDLSGEDELVYERRAARPHVPLKTKRKKEKLHLDKFLSAIFTSSSSVSLAPSRHLVSLTLRLALPFFRLQPPSHPSDGAGPTEGVRSSVRRNPSCCICLLRPTVWINNLF